MLKRVIYLLTLLILAGAFSASAQEVLSASRIQARASRRHPALGLPVRSDGQIDPIIWHDAGAWKGADSRRAVPFWTMSSVGEATLPAVQVSADPAQPSGPSAGPAQLASGSSSGPAQLASGSSSGPAQPSGPSAGPAQLASGSSSGPAQPSGPSAGPAQLASGSSSGPAQPASARPASGSSAGPAHPASARPASGPSAGPAQPSGPSAGPAQPASAPAQPAPARPATGSARAASGGRGLPLEWGAELAPVRLLCEKWLAERPHNPVDVVWGPYRGGWFAAACKRTGTDLGWKSLGFIIPAGGADPSRSLYIYSTSVNRLEHLVGYNLFPKLPSHLQEIIEEITAAELLCPYQEFDPGLLDEAADPDIDYDSEADAREP